VLGKRAGNIILSVCKISTRYQLFAFSDDEDYDSYSDDDYTSSSDSDEDKEGGIQFISSINIVIPGNPTGAPLPSQEPTPTLSLATSAKTR